MARDKVIEDWNALNARYADRNVPVPNMQMRPKHGFSGKAVAKTAGELLDRAGQGHIQGSGLATGRVSKRLAAQAAGGDFTVRPSMRSQILADSDVTAEEHDMAPGMHSVWHPEHIEDREVRAAGLPPLRSTSRAGFMPGLGSVAMHNQEARAHRDVYDDLKRDHRSASRRLQSASARGDAAAMAEHGATVKDLSGQMAERASLVAHHRQKAGEIAQAKVTSLQLIKSQSDLDTTGHPSFGAAALAAHKQYFDPETKEEFYPVASQHQLGDVAAAGGVGQTQATNLTAMSSAQRSWRRRDPDSDEVSHPNLAMAAHFAGHYNGLVSSGRLDQAEQGIRASAESSILADRAKASAKMDEKNPLKTGEPRAINTEVTPQHVEAHVQDRLAKHIANTMPPPGGQMGMSEAHGRQMAKLLMAKSPEEMADVWATTDSDKRPTFALALAATHESRSVRRQSAQAMTVDTHRAKELEVPYHEVLGTGRGMHTTARQEIPHQPGKSVQPAYNAMAMYGTRSALQMSAANIRSGGAAVTPRYAQENPWGLFAAENMADVAAATKARKAGGSGRIRERSSGYYTGQGGEEAVRSFKAPVHHALSASQFSDEHIL